MYIFANFVRLMKIVLIGAGNLATNLGLALHEANHDIVQVFSRTMTSAKLLAAAIESVPTNDLDAITDEADLYILSVKDSILTKIIDRICKNKSQKVFVHTAGSMPLDCFKGKAEHYGVFYPMQTFSKQRRVAFENIPIFLEASDDFTLQKLTDVAESISKNVRNLSTDKRRYLHLAAVWACNYANHCYDMAAEVLKKADLPFSVMLELTDETARKVHDLSPREAQTGPAIRYDTNVIEAQMELMKDMPEAKKLYEELAKSIHETSKKKV